MSLSPPQNSKNKRKHATGGRQQTTDRTSKHGKKTFGPFLEPPRQGTSQQPNPRTYVTPAHALSRAQLAVEPIACCENPWPNAWEVRSLVQQSSAGPRKSPQMERIWRDLPGTLGCSSSLYCLFLIWRDYGGSVSNNSLSLANKERNRIQ
jgi:hypothetical protein